MIFGCFNPTLTTIFVRITNDGNGEGSPSVPSGAEGDTVMLTAKPNPGYKFKEWIEITKGGGTLSNTTANPAEFTIGTKPATLRATFAEDPYYQYAITYHLNGGTNDASNPATYTQFNTITLADPKKDGHTFGGWYDNDAFTGSAITGIPVNSKGDRALYAKWTAVKYDVSYQNLNGASNSNPATYTIANTPLTLADLTGGPTGYTFGGWYDNASFSGNAITAIPANSTGDKTFYAKWMAVKYDISYQNLNGASNSNPETYTIEDATIILVPPTGATGYIFEGWYDDAACNGTPITAIPANSTGDKTFYAKWTAIKYDVSYQNLNGASNSNPATYTIADTPLTLADLTGGPTGYTFDGWYDDDTFSGTSITAIPAGSTGNKTFYAKWTAVKYDVSVNASPQNGGSVTGGGTYSHEDSVTVKASANSAYTFKYWTENGSVVSKNASYTFKITSTRNLIAVFESAGTPNPPVVNQYSITVKATQGGKVTGGGKYVKNNSVTLTAVADKGYIFEHWAYTSDPQTPVSSNATYTFTAAKDVSLIAVFAPEKLYYSEGMNGTWTQGDSSGLTFRTNGTYELFTHITVDGSVVSDKDSEIKSGSTIILLKAAFLKTLSAGTHTLEAFYANGTSTKTQFEIAAAGGTTPTNPDNESPAEQPAPTDGQNAVDSANTTVVRTNASGARSNTGQQEQNARGGQTGDDIYERLGLHTMMLLAALLLLIAQLRKVMEENALPAISRVGAFRKTKDVSVRK